MPREGTDRYVILNADYTKFALVELPPPPHLPDLITWQGRLFFRDSHAEYFREVEPYKLTREDIVK